MILLAIKELQVSLHKGDGGWSGRVLYFEKI